MNKFIISSNSVIIVIGLYKFGLMLDQRRSRQTWNQLKSNNASTQCRVNFRPTSQTKNWVEDACFLVRRVFLIETP